MIAHDMVGLDESRSNKSRARFGGRATGGLPFGKILSSALVALTVASDAFADDGYLASDGSQTLNLGYRATPTSRIEIDFQLTSDDNGQFVCGVWSENLNYGVWRNGSGNFEFRFNGGWSGGKFEADQNRHLCTIDMATGLCRILTDGAETASHAFATLPTANSDFPLAAFAAAKSSAGTAFQSPASTRIYSIRVYENDELVHSYLPCVKGGRAGFLDEQTSQFLAPDVAVESGGDIKTIEDDPYVSTPNAGVIVDTGYYFSEKTRIECDYEILDDSSSGVFLFGGGYDSMCEARAYIGTTSDGSKVINYGFCTNRIYSSTWVGVGKGLRRTITLDGAAGTASLVTGVTTNFAGKLSQPYAGKSPETLRIFSLWAKVTSSCIKAKLYGFRIYEDGVLVRDYRPQIIDGFGVLADAVDGSWIKSRTTTELSYGGAIAENNDAYLESNGRQGINLGYKVKTTSRVEVDFRFPSNSGTDHGHCVLGGGISMDYNPIRLGFLRNKQCQFEFLFPGASGGSSPWTGNLGAADVKRHVGVIDVKRQMCTVTLNGAAMGTKSSSKTPTADADYPLGLFGTTTSSTSGDVFHDTYPASVRVYHVKVYESDVLVKHWIPFVKDGEVGLKETVGGTFIGCGNNGRRTLPSAVGGEIGYESCPPYIESDGTQSINLGVKPKANARIEAEFSMCQTNNLALGLLGSIGASGTIDRTLFWFNGSGGLEPCLRGEWYGSWALSSFAKQTCSLNYATGVATLAGAADKTKSVTVSSGATYPLGLFGLTGNAAGTSFSYTGLKAKVYSVKVYEGDTLTNEFVPWVENGEIGLRDAQTGTFVTKSSASAAALKIGGVGTTCAIAPQTVTVQVDDSATLVAGASGAVSFKWFRNGEEIAGETGCELTVAWRRQRVADTVSVRPVYQLYGRTIVGEPVSATVSYAKAGCIFIIR